MPRRANEICGMCLSFSSISAECMLMEQSRKECMFRWTTVSTEWQKATEMQKKKKQKAGTNLCSFKTARMSFIVCLSAWCRPWQTGMYFSFNYRIWNVSLPTLTIQFYYFNFIVSYWRNYCPPHITSLLHWVSLFAFWIFPQREKKILLRRCKQNSRFGNIIILGNANMKHWYLLKKYIDIQ